MPPAVSTKRDRTRAALLVAVQQSLLTAPPGGVTVGRVTELADVAQGTFYNYFDSLTAALDAVGSLVLAEHGRVLDEAIRGVDDRAEVFARSTRASLHIVASQPDYGRLMFDVGLPVDLFLGGLRARLHADVLLGVDAGRFADGDLPATVSALTGATLGAALDLHRGRLGPQDVPAVTDALLRLLGVPARTAARLANTPFDVVAARPLPLTPERRDG